MPNTAMLQQKSTPVAVLGIPSATDFTMHETRAGDSSGYNTSSHLRYGIGCDFSVAAPIPIERIGCQEESLQHEAKLGIMLCRMYLLDHE